MDTIQLFADIINFLPDATLVIDRDGKVIAWNHAIEEMTGVERVLWFSGQIPLPLAAGFFHCANFNTET